MKILILDDEDIRHDGFKSILKGHELTHVKTYADALFAFRAQPFDMACLDHDLEDYSGEDGMELTGDDVCYWFRGYGRNYLPKKIRIHSHNPVGAANMAFRLKDLPVEVVVKPFHAPRRYP